MSVTPIPAEFRRIVSQRAQGLCEYFLVAEEDTLLGCQCDHIISEKHGGPTTVENLAMACVFCNRAKGSDVGSIDRNTAEFVRFYHPRSDRWLEHFELVGPRILGRSSIGLVTVTILRVNSPDRVLERVALQAIGRYPNDAALLKMQFDPPMDDAGS